MPYVNEPTRIDLRHRTPKIPGELNYEITQLIVQYVKDKGLSYNTINDVVGALTAAKDEFNRRAVGPYEDQKIAINGDVYQDILP